MGTMPRGYAREVKDEALRLLEGGMSRREVAAELDINEGPIREWLLNYFLFGDAEVPDLYDGACVTCGRTTEKEASKYCELCHQEGGKRKGRILKESRPAAYTLWRKLTPTYHLNGPLPEPLTAEERHEAALAIREKGFDPETRNNGGEVHLPDASSDLREALDDSLYYLYRRLATLHGRGHAASVLLTRVKMVVDETKTYA